MLLNFLFSPPNDDDDNADVQDDTPLIVNLLPLILSVSYVFFGAFYYFYESRKQKLRLQQLDSARDQFQSRITI